MITPSHIIKTRVERKRAYFNHYSCRATVELPGRMLAEQIFYGSDGREVRARAEAWVHREAEAQARAYQTAWRSVRESKQFSWG